MEKKTNKQNKSSSKTEGTIVWRRMEIFSGKSKIGPKAYNTAYSQVVTQPGTDAARQELTSVIGREPVRCLWCGRRRKTQAESCVLAPLTETAATWKGTVSNSNWCCSAVTVECSVMCLSTCGKKNKQTK